MTHRQLTQADTSAPNITRNADTRIQDGNIPVTLDSAGRVLQRGKPRETRIFNGKTYLMETALTGDVALVRAWKVDEAGNCVFR